MKVEIKNAILALVQVDDTMTHEDRLSVAKFLSGESQEELIKRKEAADKLKCHTNTIDRMIRENLLVAIYGADGHVKGVTKSSIDKYLSGRKVA